MRTVTMVRDVIGRWFRRSVVGALEIPADGAMVPAGRLELVGWALSSHGPIGRIEVRVDGADVGRARPLAMARADVARRWRRAPCAPLAGFTHVVTIAGEPGARRRIEVDVVDLAGARRALASVEVRVTAPAEGTRTIAAAPYPSVTRPAAPTDMVRVVVFTHQLDVGGGQLFLQEILRGLLADPGFSVVVVSAKDGVLRAELEALGADVYVVEYPVKSSTAYEARVHLLELVVRSHDARVVLVNTMSAGIGADVACRLALPVAWAIHESYALSDFWTTAYGKDGTAPEVRGCIERALGVAPAVLFEADATQALFAETVPAERRATLHYGVWVDAITQFRAGHDRTQVRASLGLHERATVVLCMGTFEPRKAQGALVAAFGEIVRSRPDVTLVLVGDTGTDYAAGVRDVAERLQLGARVRLVPVIEDHFPWYLAADVFVIASDVESMPRTLLEAMAFELPVAAAAVWGVPEVVTDGEHGLLFEPRDVAALVAVLEQMLDLPADERRALGAAAAEKVAREHDAAAYVGSYCRLLRALAQDPDMPLTEVIGSRAG